MAMAMARAAATSPKLGTSRNGRSGCFASRVRASSVGREPLPRQPPVPRRAMLVSSTSVIGAVFLGFVQDGPAFSAPVDPQNQKDELQTAALAAFNARDFPTAAKLLTQLSELDPGNYQWKEALGQVFVDGGGFAFGTNNEASVKGVEAYTDALTLIDKSENNVALIKARLLAGRAQAFEVGLVYKKALMDYDESLATATQVNAPNDPLIVNQKANVLAALGNWADARDLYLQSADGFRNASKKGGSSPSDTKFRADGVAFAATNAALALAQLGDLPGAERELRSVSRRAPGMVDTRAALSAIYWESNRGEDAEREWEFACDLIDTGCAKYRDRKWLVEVRRWPPVMVGMLQKFLSITS